MACLIALASPAGVQAAPSVPDDFAATRVLRVRMPTALAFGPDGALLVAAFYFTYRKPRASASTACGCTLCAGASPCRRLRGSGLRSRAACGSSSRRSGTTDPDVSRWRQWRRACGNAVELEDVGDDVRVVVLGQAARVVCGHRVANQGVQLARAARAPSTDESFAGKWRRTHQVGAVT